MHVRAMLLLCLLPVGCGPSNPDDTDVPSPTPVATPGDSGTPSPPPATPVEPTLTPPEPTPTPLEPTPTPLEPSATPSIGYADVLAVEVTGDPGAYTFGVTVLSPDIDCSQYTDWWEVLTPDGALLYRRILDHSHPDEQPFTRTGEPVPILETEPVIVRAHMNTTGYGGAALQGTVSGGITSLAELPTDFASELEDQPPLPESCLFRESD